MTVAPSPDLMDDEGVETSIAELAPASPAARSGLREGDVLIKINDEMVKRPSDVLDISFYLTGGDEVPVTVKRAGETITLHVEAGDEPGSPRARAARQHGTLSRHAAEQSPTGMLRLERDR